METVKFHGGMKMRRRHAWLGTVTALLVVIVAARLGYETWRLLLDPSPSGGTDLRTAQIFVKSWFQGHPTYISRFATHPPATFAALWPFTGWLSWTAARWLWAPVMAASLAVIASLGLREAGIAEPRERRAAVLFLLAMAPTAFGIGNGQLTSVVVAALLAAIVILRREPTNWRRDVVAALALVVALLKPHVSIPFLLVVILGMGGLRPVALACIAYLALTAFSLSFQQESALMVLADWLVRVRTAPPGGHVNIHAAAKAVGLESWGMVFSFAILAVTALWIYRHRRTDLWSLLGVAAIVARLWTYHGLYDDLLMIFPMIALYRMTDRNEAARVPLVLGALAVLAPITPHGWTGAVEILWDAAFTLAWLTILAFLVRATARITRPSLPSPARPGD